MVQYCTPHARTEGLDIHGVKRLPAGPQPRRRRGLISGHGGGAIVQNDQNEPDLLHNRIDEGRDACVEKGRVPHGGDDIRPLFQVLVGMVKSGGLGDGGPHAEDGIHRPQIEA